MITRRGLLRFGLQLSLVSAWVAETSTATAAETSCADSKMDAGLSASLHYAERAPDPTKACAGCGFFQAGTNGCGTCQIFNSTVNPKGHCDSWAARS
jgi:hypothetical protein